MKCGSSLSIISKTLQKKNNKKKDLFNKYEIRKFSYFKYIAKNAKIEKSLRFFENL